MLGDFDFPTLQTNAGLMGSLYFLSYVFMIFFVLLNMFLAIINDTYVGYKGDIKNLSNDFELRTYFKENLIANLRKKKEELSDVQKVFEGIREVSFEEFKQKLIVSVDFVDAKLKTQLKKKLNICIGFRI